LKGNQKSLFEKRKARGKKGYRNAAPAEVEEKERGRLHNWVTVLENTAGTGTFGEQPIVFREGGRQESGKLNASFQEKEKGFCRDARRSKAARNTVEVKLKAVGGKKKKNVRTFSQATVERNSQAELRDGPPQGNKKRITAGGRSKLCGPLSCLGAIHIIQRKL